MPPIADRKSFRSDRLNRVLVANEFWTRSLDAFSTVRKLNDPCRCFREASRFFGMDMTPVFKTQVSCYSYFLGIAAAYHLFPQSYGTPARIIPATHGSCEVYPDPC